MDSKQKLKNFEFELLKIEDEKLRQFASKIIVDAGDWFFVDPASTSGNYHPKFANEEGGLVKHTKAVFYFLNSMFRSNMFDVDGRQEDLLRVGAIAHDIRKHTEGNVYVENHAEEAAKYIMEMADKNPDLISHDDAEYIAKAVAAHMGIWGDPEPKTDAERILHLADYIASRRPNDIDFVKLDEELQKPEQRDQKVNDPKDYIFTFGKHTGKTIGEISKRDMPYLVWVNEQTDFKQKRAKKFVKYFLEEQKKH